MGAIPLAGVARKSLSFGDGWVDVRKSGTAESTTSCVTKQDASCLLPLVLPATSVTFSVTTDAKCNQVVHHIATKPTPGFYVMDLQAFHGTTLLTAPTIPFEDTVSDYCVLFRVQFEPRSLLT